MSGARDTSVTVPGTGRVPNAGAPNPHGSGRLGFLWSVRDTHVVVSGTGWGPR